MSESSQKNQAQNEKELQRLTAWFDVLIRMDLKQNTIAKVDKKG